MYCLTSYQKLLRLNFTFMVRKIGQLLFNEGGDLNNFFMDKCPKDKSTAKNLVCRKPLLIPEKNWKNLLGVASPFSHRRVKLTVKSQVLLACV